MLFRCRASRNVFLKAQIYRKYNKRSALIPKMLGSFFFRIAHSKEREKTDNSWWSQRTFTPSPTKSFSKISIEQRYVQIEFSVLVRGYLLEGSSSNSGFIYTNQVPNIDQIPEDNSMNLWISVQIPYIQNLSWLYDWL